MKHSFACNSTLAAIAMAAMAAVANPAIASIGVFPELAEGTAVLFGTPDDVDMSGTVDSDDLDALIDVLLVDPSSLDGDTMPFGLEALGGSGVVVDFTSDGSTPGGALLSVPATAVSPALALGGGTVELSGTADARATLEGGTVELGAFASATVASTGTVILPSLSPPEAGAAVAGARYIDQFTISDPTMAAGPSGLLDLSFTLTGAITGSDPSLIGPPFEPAFALVRVAANGTEFEQEIIASDLGGGSITIEVPSIPFDYDVPFALDFGFGVASIIPTAPAAVFGTSTLDFLSTLTLDLARVEDNPGAVATSSTLPDFTLPAAVVPFEFAPAWGIVAIAGLLGWGRLSRRR